MYCLMPVNLLHILFFPYSNSTNSSSVECKAGKSLDNLALMIESIYEENLFTNFLSPICLYAKAYCPLLNVISFLSPNIPMVEVNIS
jgi:hypothetical protein